MLAGFVSVLAGDLSSLEETFFTRVTGDEQEWRVQLRPRSSRMAAHVKLLSLHGNATGMNRFRIELEGGEWQEIRLLPAADP